MRYIITHSSGRKLLIDQPPLPTYVNNSRLGLQNGTTLFSDLAKVLEDFGSIACFKQFLQSCSLKTKAAHTSRILNVMISRCLPLRNSSYLEKVRLPRFIRLIFPPSSVKFFGYATSLSDDSARDLSSLTPARRGQRACPFCIWSKFSK